jgi:hypothetical protein
LATLPNKSFVSRRWPRWPTNLFGHLALGVAGFWAGVSQVVKTAQSRERLGVPCLDTMILALRRRALAGAPAADRRNPSLRCHNYGLLHRTSGGQALMLSRWWAAVARVGRKGCKAIQGRRCKTALTYESWSYSSTDLGCRPERIHNSLVTMSARYSSSRPS